MQVQNEITLTVCAIIYPNPVTFLVSIAQEDLVEGGKKKKRRMKSNIYQKRGFVSSVKQYGCPYKKTSLL